MKSRSLITWILVTVLFAALLAGCGSGGSQNKDGQAAGGEENNSNAEQTGDAKGDNTNAEQAGDTDGEIDITLVASTYKPIFDTFDPDNDAFAKLIKDKFNLNIKPVAMDGLDAIKLAAASNSLPDIFHFGIMYDIKTFNDWVNQGIIRDIPDEMISRFSNIKRIMDSNRLAAEAKQLYGKNWFIVKPNSLDPEMFKVSWPGIYFRKDWMANVGITKQPETFDELYQLLKAYKEEDPDQNGKKDTYGLTCNTVGMLTTLFTNWGVNPGDWTLEGGKWIPAYLSDKNIEPLQYFQKLFQEGLLDPEFSINNSNQAMQKFASNTFGSIVRNTDTYWLWKVIIDQFGQANTDISNPLDAVGVLKPIKASADSQPAYAETVDSDGMLFRAGLEDEKMERYLEMHDWLLSPEGIEYRLGFEGKEYKKDEQGRVITFNDPETNVPYDVMKIYPALTLQGCVGYAFEKGVDPKWPGSSSDTPEIKQLALELMQERDKYPFKVNVAMMLVSTPAKDSLSFDYQTEFANMIMGKEDVESAFARFKETALASGVQTAIDEANAAAQEMGIK